MEHRFGFRKPKIRKPTPSRGPLAIWYLPPRLVHAACFQVHNRDAPAERASLAELELAGLVAVGMLET